MLESFSIKCFSILRNISQFFHSDSATNLEAPMGTPFTIISVIVPQENTIAGGTLLSCTERQDTVKSVLRSSPTIPPICFDLFAPVAIRELWPKNEIINSSFAKAASLFKRRRIRRLKGTKILVFPHERTH